MTAPTASSTRRYLLFSLRYAVPAVVCLVGVLIAALAGGLDSYGPDAMAALFGAGGAIYLMNAIMRMGISGDHDRDVEEARRLFLDRYGIWPDEAPAGWRSPDRDEELDVTLGRFVAEREASDVAA
jgi:hypothetical protein